MYLSVDSYSGTRRKGLDLGERFPQDSRAILVNLDLGHLDTSRNYSVTKLGRSRCYLNSDIVSLELLQRNRVDVSLVFGHDSLTRGLDRWRMDPKFPFVSELCHDELEWTWNLSGPSENFHVFFYK